MILFLFFFVCAVCRYQYLSEQEVIDVITVSKEEALSRISSADGPSYLLTKNRKRYNCTNTYQRSVIASSQDPLLVVSNNLLKEMVFEGKGDYGTVSIYPNSHVLINSIEHERMYFEVDPHTKQNIHFGESNVSEAKLTELYMNPSTSSTKLKVTYLCSSSILSYDSNQRNKLGYTLSQGESPLYSWHFTVTSDLFCLTEEEDTGYNEIWKRLSDKVNQKSSFVNGGWKYTVHHKINITQTYVSSNTVYNLGYYNDDATRKQGLDIVHHFKPSEPHDSYVNIIYDNGDECATTGRNRTSYVHLVCPSSFSVLSDTVIETEHCHYEVYTSSPWVCNLPWMKKPKRVTRSVICYDLSEELM